MPLTVASASSPDWCHVQAGAIGKLADHRLGHRNLGVVGLRLVFEDGNSEGMDGVGQMSRGSEGVISATGDGKQSKTTSRTKGPRMLCLLSH